MTRLLTILGAALVGGAVVALVLHGQAKSTNQTTPTTKANARGLARGVLPLQAGAGLNLLPVEGPIAAQPVVGDPLETAAVPGTLLYDGWQRQPEIEGVA